MSHSKVYVIGVGVTEFLKPRGKVSYTELGLQASVKALIDCDLTYDSIEQAYCGYVYGDSTCGQRVLYQLGMTQIPIINVNNNCSTGSTALWMGRNAIRGGGADCVLCVGWEQMEAGSLKGHFPNHTSPGDKTVQIMAETRGIGKGPMAAQIFGNAGIEYMEKYGAKPEHFAEIARINHAHSVNNPYSQFHDVYTLEQIMSSPSVHNFMTKLQCCPTSDGAAATVICSQRFLDKHPHLKPQAVEIAGQALATDDVALLGGSAIELVGAEMTRRAADMVYKESGIGPQDVQVVECHDCFSANEMYVPVVKKGRVNGRVCLDALGLAERGKAHELVTKGDITFGGKYLVNPSGGLISKGHPIGATGLAQASELVWHLRGWATNRAKPHTRHCLQHNVGLGGAVVVTMYRRPDDSEAPSPENSKTSQGNVDDGRKWAGYNPAIEARWVDDKDLERVRSKTKGSKKMVEGRKPFKGDQARL